MKLKMKGYVGKLKDSYWYAKSKYIKYYDKLPINDKMIFMEAQHGKELNGNIFYILKYLSKSDLYRDFELYVSAFGRKNGEDYRELLDRRGYHRVNVVIVATDEYYRAISSAKYLINDNTFLPFFTKKEGQVYLNTWHGTPLKTLGKQIANDAANIGNTQKNFVAADYLMFPNEYTKQHMVEDYMLENISPHTKTVLCAYPRNEIFFDEACREQTRKELGLCGKRIYVYMPTYRGRANDPGVTKSDTYQFYYLYELDKLLTEDEVLFVKLHLIDEKKVCYDDFTHIRCFPEHYETYEVLNIADVLMADYSSVMFDFACTGRKIVLFPFDKEDYLRDRGTYIQLDDLPFPQVFSLEELAAELRSGKEYDDTAFLQKFCPYDNKQSAKQLCDFIILQKDNGLCANDIPDNGKENVLIYVGDLAKNGVTASLKALLNYINLDKRNYFITFCQARAWRNSAQLATLPKKVHYFAMAGWFNLSPLQKMVRILFEKKKLSAKTFDVILRKRLEQNLLCSYGGARIDTLIEFNGYDDDIIMMYSAFKGKKCIYAHSDMANEAKTRGNSRMDVIRYAYDKYDRVMAVSEAIVPPMKKLFTRNSCIKVCKNVIDYKRIQSQALQPIAWEAESECSIPFSELISKLDSPSPKFINIGRFSPEKGHERLIKAFCKIREKQPDALLFIMGGNSYGDNYEVLLEKIQTMGLTDCVILLLNIANPYPILNACDYFVLSSFYEGFGLVLAEADILGKPVVSTDIDGPRDFMLKNGGTLVDNTDEGIYQGMEMLLNGQITQMNADYEKYNEECVREFEDALSYEKKGVHHANAKEANP